MNDLADVFRRIAALEKRVADMIKHGAVKEVNTAEGWVRFDFGEGDNGTFLSPKVNYAQMAGDMKFHNPPSVGQQMTYFAPGGDPRQAVALPMTWSDQNQSPSDKGDEHVMTLGAAKVVITGSSIEVTVGGTGFVLDAGEMRMTTTLRAKGGSRPAHYVGGVDSDGDAAVDGNAELLI